jgi:biopolymer transport protein ExbD
MNFRNRHHSSQIPDVNLIPLIDVLMSVLTFFIIISMTFTGQQVLQVQIPTSSTPSTAKGQKSPQVNSLVVGLTLQGKIILENQPANLEQLAARIQTYLINNPQGKITLSADRQLPYAKISILLKQMGKMGGDRVSLLLRDQ